MILHGPIGKPKPARGPQPLGPTVGRGHDGGVRRSGWAEWPAARGNQERCGNMAVKTVEFEVQTGGFCHLEDVTTQVREALAKSGLRDGIACVAVAGSTAGVSTMEYEPGLLQDVPELMERVAPSKRRYHHDDTWQDGNGFSHVRSFLLKTSHCLPFSDGELLLGTWQQIVLADFDNRPRARRIVVQLVGE